MKQPTVKDTSHPVVAIKQQEQPNRQYVGYWTDLYLRQVEEGVLTQESLQMWLDLNHRTRNNHPSPFNGLYHISLQEALAILREHEGTEQTPHELLALVQEYQADIADTRRYPKRWTNKHLTPERAREWYKQQINRIQQQLQGRASKRSQSMSKNVYCPSCGTANRSTAKFCMRCGAQTEPLVSSTTAFPISLAQQHQTQQIGAVLQGQYAILRPLGSGGMGQVYLAQDRSLGDRLVAIKAIHQQGLTRQEQIEATHAFRQEAFLLAGLVHPNLPRVYAHFTEEECSYLVMDYIQGETLEAYLAQKGTLTFEELLPLAVQLCDVLSYLHSQPPPIVFRDLKPANIMLVGTHLYLIDFGIARHFKAGQSKDTVAMGSQGYAAPEQYGKAQTTSRADIYALGAVMHQMVTGDDPSEQPFFFKSVAHPPLQALLEQMLVPDPSLRLASAQEVKERLLAIQRRPQPRKKASPGSTTAHVRTTQPAPNHQQSYFSLSSPQKQNSATIEILELLSPEDGSVVERGEKLLKTLGRSTGKEINLHRGADASPGDEVQRKWQQRIQEATIILYFVSANFLADDELVQRTEQIIRACHGKKVILPVNLKRNLLFPEGGRRATIEAIYSNPSPLVSLAPIPMRKAIASFTDKDEGWLEVIEAVRQQLKL